MPVLEGALMAAAVKGSQITADRGQKAVREYYTKHPDKLAKHLEAARKAGKWGGLLLLEALGQEWLKEFFPGLFPKPHL